MQTMSHIFLLILSLSLFSCAIGGKRNHLGQRIIPLEDFFRNPVVSQYSIAPDGKHFAYLKPYKNRMNIFVQDVARKHPEVRLTSQEDRDIAGFFWKGNQTLIFIRDFGGDENFHLFRVSLDQKNEQDLTPFEDTRVGVVDKLEEIDPSSILISMNKRNKTLFDVYRLNIDTGDLKLVAENPGSIMGWLTDHNGQVRIAVASDGVNNTILYRDSEKQKFTTLMQINFKDSFDPQMFDFDNRHLIVLSNLGRDKSALVVYDPKTKKEKKVLYGRDDVDLMGVNYSRLRKKLTSVDFVTWKLDRNFVDPATKEVFAQLTEKLPDQEIHIVSQSRNEDQLIVRTFSDRSLGSFYLYDVEKQKLTLLAELSPWLKSEQLAPMTAIEYQSRDGLTIPAYLTLPLGVRPGQKLPTIVVPHGGPWARDVWGYRPGVQFLANRGYAVLQMNFRGSTGYGRKFWAASFKQWGKSMQDDITDGVEFLIEQGIADRERIGIYGVSYGGYAVLAGLAFTPDLYAAGVDYVGVANIFTLLETIPPYWKPMLDKFYEMIGHPVKDKTLLKEVSPVFHVDRIKAPLMVVQGAKDPRVKKSESDQIVEALKSRGIDVPYILKEDEGHGFQNEENKFELYAEIEKFFAKHLLEN